MSTEQITAPMITLAAGAKMPMLALGTWPMNDEEAAVAVESALSIGYRHLDTAEAYGNERGVGEGLRRSGVPRDEVFITTKFQKQWHSVDGARQAFENSAERLGVEYIDLLMVHWPNPAQGGYVDAVRGLVKLRDEGLIKAVGVSNFKPAHLQPLFDEGLVPEVNQLQLEPEHVWPEEQRLHREHGIVTVAYSPLGRGGTFLESDAVRDAAKAHGKTPSQVVLRWHMQQGIPAAPKSADPGRQRENLDIFNFELTEVEMSAISALDTGGPARLDSDEFGH